MAYVVEVEYKVGWVPDGSGNTFLSQAQANVPGQGQVNQPRITFMAQVYQNIIAEGVPGGDAPTLANINTALTNAVFDIAGSTGTPQINPTVLAQIQGFATGGA